jgi:hypothetical protein
VEEDVDLEIICVSQFENHHQPEEALTVLST